MAGLKNFQEFTNRVGIKFQLYNSLFTSLPFHRIEKTGVFVSILMVNCEEGYKKNQSPIEIIDQFFAKQIQFTKEEEQVDLLFRFVQYIERQVVLFDSLEDAAFTQVNDMNGVGTLKHLVLEIEEKNKVKELTDKLKEFSIQLVLTAHPTQFYRSAVLGIINDLSCAVSHNNETEIYTYLQQLGRTPFFQQQKPTPYDEAVSLIWYLEHVFYDAVAKIIGELKFHFPEAVSHYNPVIKMGFWPGGDRDGNPFVNTKTTLLVAEALRKSIIKCYYADVRKLKRRLTFKGVDVAVAELENLLQNHLYDHECTNELNKEILLKSLRNIRHQLIYDHNQLFVDLVDSLLNKIELFGFHFATLDIRQDSNVHTKLFDQVALQTTLLPNNYSELPNAEKIVALSNLNEPVEPSLFKEEIFADTIASVQAIRTIQQFNGEAGCNRYIISQCNTALNVMEVYGLFLIAGWEKEAITVDIIPLFETVEDLHNAGAIMEALYSNENYSTHVARRNNKQTIMLGFSDGTKDGGYFMANWSIYKAKATLTSISKQYGIDVVFFDGRGGPPARGGGKTHKFYASMGKNISNKQIQLTIQGQTVTSNFGTIESAQFNIEQLLHAGISNGLFAAQEETFEPKEDALLQILAERSYQSYSELKNHPYFIEYLGHASPLRFYAETNIGSRPSKRGGNAALNLKDLRAIPFVGAWSQLKQNVTGYYGVGTALQFIEQQGKWAELYSLYHGSLFFKTLMDNCEMAMKKCYFPLTAFFSAHEKYGEIWSMIFQEYELTKKYLFKLSGKQELMADYPVEQLSINMRERIVLPLVTIQQFAIYKVREMEEKGLSNKSISNLKNAYEKLVMRCSFGIISAGRNSA